MYCFECPKLGDMRAFSSIEDQLLEMLRCQQLEVLPTGGLSVTELPLQCYEDVF